MSLSAAAMQLLHDKGLSVDDIIAVAAANEASRLSDATEKRKAYDRERKAKKAVEKRNSTGIPTEQVCALSTGNSTGIPPETPPLACVRDKPLTKVLTGFTDTADETRGAGGKDDWPKGKAEDHARLLVETCATSRLDLAREGGLAISLGLIHRWRTAGASWEFDVLPVVTGLAARARKPIKSWSYFDGAIADSIIANRQALTLPEAANVTQIRPGTGPPRQSITDKIADENRQVHELLAAEIERRSGRTN